MGADPVTATIGAAVIGSVVNAFTGQQQAKATKKAASQSAAASEKLYQQQEKEINRQNARGPDTEALFDRNKIEGQQGVSGTLLTGPQGVDPKDLSLGKNTLLGGA